MLCCSTLLLQTPGLKKTHCCFKPRKVGLPAVSKYSEEYLRSDVLSNASLFGESLCQTGNYPKTIFGRISYIAFLLQGIG